MITVRVISTYKQFVFFTNMLQELTDLLFKNQLLLKQTQYHQYFYEYPKDPQPIMQVPFEIIMIQVPKNFLRKIVGYQEKNLFTLRKHCKIDFDYNRDLLTDDVYQLNENT